MKRNLTIAAILAALAAGAAPASAGALAQLEGAAGQPAPALSAPAPEPGGLGYAEAVAEFDAYRRGKMPGIKNEDNLPFILEHGGPARASALLIHGLVDSPWYMRAVGEILYRQGYNVIGILLPGHGTRPEDLFKVKKADWQAEVDKGLRIAAGLGGKISVGGFSTGGALALDALYRHPGLGASSLLLFSPAVAVARKDELKAAAACVAPPLAMHFMGPYNGPADAVEDNPHRYTKMSINGVCQLYYLTNDNRWHRPAILSRLRAGTRVFAAQSGKDDWVSAEAVRNFMASAPNPEFNDFIWYPAGLGLEHTDVPRPEANPAFPELERRLAAFAALRP